MNLVTIKVFDNVLNLGLVQSYLESEGIRSFTKDENMGQIYSGAVDLFKIKLQVDEADVDEAIQILIKGGFARSEDFEGEEVNKAMLKLGRILDKISGWFKK